MLFTEILIAFQVKSPNFTFTLFFLYFHRSNSLFSNLLGRVLPNDVLILQSVFHLIDTAEEI